MGGKKKTVKLGKIGNWGTQITSTAGRATKLESRGNERENEIVEARDLGNGLGKREKEK